MVLLPCMQLRIKSVPRTSYPPYATLDQDCVPILPSGMHVHETAEKNATKVDDGNAGHEWSAASAPHVAVGPTRACAPEFRDAVQTQDGGNGAGRPASSQLQDQPKGKRREERE